jgi:arylformamidase
MSKYIDITRPIREGMAIYPENPGVQIKKVKEAGNGSSALSAISFGSHTGTHIDALSHVDPKGEGTAGYSLDLMNGEVLVLDFVDKEIVSAQDLPDSLPERVIIKTNISLGDVDEFKDDFVGLDDSTAEKLVDEGTMLIGIDSWSVKKRGVKNNVHKTLLEAGIVIIEGLWLKDVSEGKYWLHCLPLKVDSDGAPVRAVLERLSGM